MENEEEVVSKRLIRRRVRIENSAESPGTENRYVATYKVPERHSNKWSGGQPMACFYNLSLTLVILYPVWLVLTFDAFNYRFHQNPWQCPTGICHRHRTMYNVIRKWLCIYCVAVWIPHSFDNNSAVTYICRYNTREYLVLQIMLLVRFGHLITILKVCWPAIIKHTLYQRWKWKIHKFDRLKYVH